MTPNYEYLLDDVGWQILETLQVDARVSFRELGERIGLTGAAVAERVRKMEEAGIVKGYWTEFNYERLGFPITAFIKVNAAGEASIQLKEFIKTLPQLIESHHVVGGESVIFKVVMPSLHALESLIETLSHYGTVHPSIVLSSFFHAPDLKRKPDAI
ncbi:MAG: Lrp/AsnC family transcriptional regulator [Cyanobacteria bacterium]|nr:Lrp/AsnC family transcriptional regulator [Cyanobacteriota bacterium]